MKTLNEMYDMCKSIEENGIMDASVNDVMEIIEVTKDILDRIIEFVDDYDTENAVDAAFNHMRSSVDTLAGVLDDLEYYLVEN